MPSGKRSGRVRAPSPQPRRGGGAKAAAKPAPVWQQVAERLEKEISGGRFRETGRLPTEAQHAAELGLSRHALRRAIAALVGKGILRSVPHIGTFVAPTRIPFTVGADTRYSEGVRAAGMTPGVRQLSLRTCTPPADAARMLSIASRTPVIEIIHLLLANEFPLGCVTLWMPADRFARMGELSDTTGSFRRALAQLGINVYRRRTLRIIARHADQQEQEWLALGADGQVISITGVCVEVSGEPTHAFNFRLNADRVSLDIPP